MALPQSKETCHPHIVSNHIRAFAPIPGPEHDVSYAGENNTKNVEQSVRKGVVAHDASYCSSQAS